MIELTQLSVANFVIIITSEGVFHNQIALTLNASKLSIKILNVSAFENNPAEVVH